MKSLHCRFGLCIFRIESFNIRVTPKKARSTHVDLNGLWTLTLHPIASKNKGQAIIFQNFQGSEKGTKSIRTIEVRLKGAVLLCLPCYHGEV